MNDDNRSPTTEVCLAPGASRVRGRVLLAAAGSGPVGCWRLDLGLQLLENR